MCGKIEPLIDKAIFDNYAWSSLNGEKCLNVQQATCYLSQIFEMEVKGSRLRSALRSGKLKGKLHCYTGWYEFTVEQLIHWFSQTKDGQIKHCKMEVYNRCRREIRLSK